jgi:N-acetylmuramoyl-L-alanine amidase
MEILKLGSRGNGVVELQRYLNLYPDGIFGKITKEAVIAYQKLHNLTPDGIVGPKTWESIVTTSSVGKEKDPGSIAGFKNLPVIKKSKRTINEIIIHCTATPEGKDYTVDDIRRWHTSPPNNWSDIGYHYCVYRNGEVHLGRDVNLVGAHAGPKHNTYSIGVVYVGGLENIPGIPVNNLPPKDTRTKEQKESLLMLLKKLRELYPKARIIGHNRVSNKSCPSFRADLEYANI